MPLGDRSVLLFAPLSKPRVLNVPLAMRAAGSVKPAGRAAGTARLNRTDRVECVRPFSWSRRLHSVAMMQYGCCYSPQARPQWIRSAGPASRTQPNGPANQS